MDPIRSFRRYHRHFSTTPKKVGKKKDGRELDGREWNEIPGVVE